MTILELTCRDPIVARDGRPFGAGQGNRMRAVGWPLPSVFAGSLRTVVGKQGANGDFSPETARQLLAVEIAGGFPATQQGLYLPAPHDCVIEERAAAATPTRIPHRAEPRDLENGSCADWPLGGLKPVMLTNEQAATDFKPKPSPAWWPLAEYAKWLTQQSIDLEGAPFLLPALVEERTHVRIDAATGAAKDENLFSTAALALTHLPRYGRPSTDCWQDCFAEITLTVRVRAAEWCEKAIANLDVLHPLGGERRLVHWRRADEVSAQWRCPEPLAQKLATATKVRMVLATPAIFKHGWKPNWIDERLSGTLPGTTVRVQLVGVSIERWKAVSGWSLAVLPGQSRGPKPVRRMVPAGGVYFFNVIGGDPVELVNRWLEPVSDNDQDQRDGFGLATWGTW